MGHFIQSVFRWALVLPSLCNSLVFPFHLFIHSMVMMSFRWVVVFVWWKEVMSILEVIPKFVLYFPLTFIYIPTFLVGPLLLFIIVFIAILHPIHIYSPLHLHCYILLPLPLVVEEAPAPLLLFWVVVMRHSHLNDPLIHCTGNYLLFGGGILTPPHCPIPPIGGVGELCTLTSIKVTRPFHFYRHVPPLQPYPLSIVPIVHYYCADPYHLLVLSLSLPHYCQVLSDDPSPSRWWCHLWYLIPDYSLTGDVWRYMMSCSGNFLYIPIVIIVIIKFHFIRTFTLLCIVCYSLIWVQGWCPSSFDHHSIRCWVVVEMVLFFVRCYHCCVDSFTITLFIPYIVDIIVILLYNLTFICYLLCYLFVVVVICCWMGPWVGWSLGRWYDYLSWWWVIQICVYGASLVVTIYRFLYSVQFIYVIWVFVVVDGR